MIDGISGTSPPKESPASPIGDVVSFRDESGDYLIGVVVGSGSRDESGGQRFDYAVPGRGVVRGPVGIRWFGDIPAGGKARNFGP